MSISPWIRMSVGAGALAAGAAFAQGQAPARTVPLGCALEPSIQYAHGDIWTHTPPGIRPFLAAAKEVVPGQRLDLVVFVRGFALDAAGTANLTYDLAEHRPDGTVRSIATGLVVAANAKVADPRALLYPRNITSLVFGAGDPPGDYRFDVTVHDRVGGGTAARSASVRLGDSDAPLSPPDGFDPGPWMLAYYQHPEPRLALPCLTALSQDPMTVAKRAGAQGALLGFYERVLADNPWLVPQFERRLVTTTSDDERRLFALVLAYVNRGNPKFGKGLPGPVREQLSVIRRDRLPVQVPDPMTGGELDILWGRFYASGSFEPIRDLVSVVQGYLKYQGQYDAYRKTLPPADSSSSEQSSGRRHRASPKPPPPGAIKDLILKVTIWSLGSAAHSSKVAHDYLLNIRQAPDTPPPVQAAIDQALAWQPGQRVL